MSCEVIRYSSIFKKRKERRRYSSKPKLTCVRSARGILTAQLNSDSMILKKIEHYEER
jgi:hypothetical protein